MNALIDGMRRADGLSVAPPLELIKTAAGIKIRIRGQADAAVTSHPFRTIIDPNDNTKLLVGVDRGGSPSISDFFNIGSRQTSKGVTETVDFPGGGGSEFFVYYEIRNFDANLATTILLKTSPTFLPLYENTGDYTEFEKIFQVVVGRALKDPTNTFVLEWSQYLFDYIQIEHRVRTVFYDEGSKALKFSFAKSFGPAGLSVGSVAIPVSFNGFVSMERNTFVVALTGDKDILIAEIQTDSSGDLVFLKDFLSGTAFMARDTINSVGWLVASAISTDRSLSTGTPTNDKLRDVLATLLRDLRDSGLLPNVVDT